MTAPTAEVSQSFSAWSQRLGASVGLAFSAVGSPAPPVVLGTWREGAAWSTMKVPLAIAVLNATSGSPSDESLRLMRRAITQSDNAAAMTLWAQLGPPTSAAAQTQSVLRTAGDLTTVVPSRAVRAEYSPFGQATWSLAAQAAFAAKLPCMPAAGHVLELMGEVTSTQRWGFAARPGPVAVKGGWGPGTAGAYLVRQMAVVTMGNGVRVAFAVAVAPFDGRFESGVSGSTAIARWVAENIAVEAPSAPEC